MCVFLGFLSDILGLDITRHYSGVIGIFLSHVLTNSIGYIFSGIILFLYIIIANMIFFKFSLLDTLINIKESIILFDLKKKKSKLNILTMKI